MSTKTSSTVWINPVSLRAAAREVMEKSGPEAASRALSEALMHVREFAQAEVVREVSGLYAIDAGEVSGTFSTSGGRTGGDMLRLIYLGRTLTLGGHFEFSPHRPRGRAYRVKSTVYRGQSVTHGRTSFVPASNDYKGDLVWKRREGSRKVDVIHTLSVPQMVSNKQLEEPISESILKRLEEEFMAAWNLRR